MDKATIQAMLSDAQTAYHELLIGRQTVSVTDQNGERIQYNLADADSLVAYIQSLQKMLQDNSSTFDPRPVSSPLFFRF